ncbi:alpha/beta fold hydrolase [Streptomyces profundus]|uniref:alpha/beta fold hydrolase n=1 Tax=Streptomyces profundus TaxID=2867410 RepID=UPI001D169F14|nr:alpha/beta hydrolase [Streptomyces sp. MA3_2.13]UED84891.1 alpha/beta hydrolase [Streptomyces sp. MA3_2.13]
MATIQLDDLPLWYHEQGSPTGDPVVLLHSAFVDSRMFDVALPHLDVHFRVLTFDRRAHGHTPDVGGPLSYELMARDTIAFLERVVNGPAHLVGHSDGANVALLVAMRRPDLVRKLVPISGNFHHEGLLPGVLEGFGEEDALRYLGTNYGAVSPDGEQHFPTVVDKVLRMAGTQPTLTEADLARITARTLVVAGDDDAMSLEHTVALYRAIPDAELAIVPRASHLLVVERPAEVYGLVNTFLTTAEPPPPTRQPIRRARQVSQPDRSASR